MVRIVHFRLRCIGCNACAEIAPDRWRMSKKDGKSVLLGGVYSNGISSVQTGDDEYDKNMIAARMCPTNIIKVEKLKRK